MKNRELTEKIKLAVDHAVPDVFDNVLTACGRQAVQAVILPAEVSRKKVHPLKALGAAAAAVVLLAGAAFGLNWTASRVDSVVILDVNPSVQLEISRSEKVLGVRAGNEDGEKVLDGMDLRGTNLDVAVNALIGSMVKHGYINEFANSILLTVENTDGARSTEIEQRLSKDISGLLKASQLDGAVLSQSVTGDTALKEMARTYGISEGKAALIQKIMKENSLVSAEELALLSVNDLNLLMSSKNISPEQVAASGSASEKGYIGKEQAKRIALEHAGATEEQVKYLEIEMDSDDGVMVYEVDFEFDGIEYDYEINAADGSVMGEIPVGADASESAGEEARMNAAEIRAIVLEHAGLKKDSAPVMEIELEGAVYDVSFHRGGREYEYLVNAFTGEIIRWESERDD